LGDRRGPDVRRREGRCPAQAADFTELGYDFIPIVWLRVDTPWRRQVAHIDRYNALAWQAARLNRPLAVIGAGGVDSAGRPLAAPLGASDKLQAMYSDQGDGVLGVLAVAGHVVNAVVIVAGGLRRVG
jgi:hypothetical protein